MRGLYFAKPLEYRLEVEGDQFVQGQPLRGTVSVTNRDGSAHSKLSLNLGLAYGEIKALKTDGVASLKILERVTLAEGFSLKPDEERREAWELPLDLMAPIQSKDASPFLLYGGDLDTREARGQIDLPVKLAPPLEAFLTTLENHFAFELRGSHCEDGVLEGRFKPPASYPTVEELSVLISLEPKAVRVEFKARGRAIAPGAKGGLKPRKRGGVRSVPAEQFLPQSRPPNRALYRSLVEEMLPEVAVRVERKGESR